MSETELSAEAARFVSPAYYIDSDSMEVQTFVLGALRNMPLDASKKDKAIRLFEAVRDNIRYDPYKFEMNTDAYRASMIAGMEATYCVPKAILLTACLRAVGVPAAVGFADVRNHLTTPKLLELMETDLFINHGYVQLWLDNKPYKVTPAFNMDLCTRFGVKPLVFDGKSDALFHEFDMNDQRHMEYVADHGVHQDAPMKDYLRTFKENYPKLETFNSEGMTKRGAEGFDKGFAQSKGGES
ncbi:transglutaminase-like domain-containing protein [Profundibacter sp.]